MKQQWAKYLIVALAGVAVGRLLPGERSESRRLSEIGTEEGRKTRSSLRDQAGPSSRIELLRREIRSTPAQNLPRLFQRSLEINNPFERREAMTEILKHASASDGMAFMEEFVKITRETGRTHGEEWRDTLFEVGRKGGAEMMDTWKASGKGGGSHEAWFSFYGMSFEDPKAGKAWLNLPSNEDFPQRERLISALIGGATLSNADEGIRMMAELPEAARRDSIGHFTWNLIQNSGPGSRCGLDAGNPKNVREVGAGLCPRS